MFGTADVEEIIEKVLGDDAASMTAEFKRLKDNEKSDKLTKATSDGDDSTQIGEAV
jgi:ribosome maturation protein Sdo1